MLENKMNKILEQHYKDTNGIFYKNAKALNIASDWNMPRLSPYIKNIEKEDYSNYEIVSGLFYDCESIEELDLSSMDIEKCDSLEETFWYCKSLKSLNISTWNFTNIIYLKNIFYKCISLTNLKFGKNLKVSINLQDSPLTHESILSVINGLADVEEQQTLWFNCKNYDKLTDEDISSVNSKNWKIVIR